jgi:hypothetical protein
MTTSGCSSLDRFPCPQDTLAAEAAALGDPLRALVVEMSDLTNPCPNRTCSSSEVTGVTAAVCHLPKPAAPRHVHDRRVADGTLGSQRGSEHARRSGSKALAIRPRPGGARIREWGHAGSAATPGNRQGSTAPGPLRTDSRVPRDGTRRHAFEANNGGRLLPVGAH